MEQTFNPFDSLEAKEKEQAAYIQKVAEHLDQYVDQNAKRVSVDELADMSEELDRLSR